VFPDHPASSRSRDGGDRTPARLSGWRDRPRCALGVQISFHVKHRKCQHVALSAPSPNECLGAKQRSDADLHSRRPELSPSYMYIPPLTLMIVPVMKDARGSARNRTAMATSSGLPSRPMGVSSRTESRTFSGTTEVMSVSM
jgi:hypothetical protein